MLIIYKKWGILMPVIFILGFFLADSLFHPHGRMQSIYFFLPAVLISLTGFLLDKKQLKNEFFFVPLKYWGIIVSILGIVILING